MTRPRAYVASPLGFTESGRDYYTTVYLPALSAVVEPLDPWTLTDTTEIAAAAGAGQLTEFWLDLGRRNASAIRSADLIVALIDGQEIDSGTAAEIGYGAALGKRCLALRSDLRQSGEDGVAANLQVVSFIVQSGGTIVGSLAELVAALAQLTG